MYLSTIALATTFKKFASILLAIERASRVFPVPGGPYSNTPFGGTIPTLTNSSGLISGSSIASRISRICSASPPMVPHPACLLYTSPSPRDRTRSRMPSSA
eukprot:TRINITY_DN4624_c0_g1_i3.p2 TRINITY_DN4624_c0_g1~~TRINITY_DN4624_c0_g1_i3.p2  ORF type:complete len:101 (-),score=16.65 TRINITY_DN4624_c0_g1_i3:91-393(-)